MEAVQQAVAKLTAVVLTQQQAQQQQQQIQAQQGHAIQILLQIPQSYLDTTLTAQAVEPGSEGVIPS